MRERLGLDGARASGWLLVSRPRPSIELPHVAAWAEALLLGLIGQMRGDEMHVGAGSRCSLHRQLS